MPNMLESGAAWLGGKLKASAGRTVSVSVGPQVVHGLIGFVSVNDYEVTDSEGFMTRVQRHDWSFESEDLEGLKYKDGPTVTITDQNGERFEVGPVGDRPAVENLDTSGVLVMLHSRKVSNA